MGNNPSNHQPLERPGVNRYGDVHTVRFTSLKQFKLMHTLKSDKNINNNETILNEIL